MFDFDIFYRAAQAILSGLSPYSIPGYYNPFPFAVLFLPFALLPKPFAYWLFILINVLLLFWICHWRGIWALLSFPVLFCLFTGQIDLFLAMMLSLGKPWLLPLALIKPQVAWVTLPWLIPKLDKSGWMKAITAGGIYLILCFIIRPTWAFEWIKAQPGFDFYSIHASSIYWLIPQNFIELRVAISLVFSIIALPIGFLIKKRSDSWTFLQLFQPLTNIYSSAVLAEWIGPLEFGLSWIVVFINGGKVHNGMPMFVIPLAILFRNLLLPRINRKYEKSINEIRRKVI